MKNLNELNNSIKDIEKQAQIFKENNSVLSKIGEIKSDIEKSSNELAKINSSFKLVIISIQKELEDFSYQIKELNKANDSLISDLSSTNKKMIRELEDALISKLDRLSSDIHNALRSEVASLEKSVKNELSEKFIKISDSFKMQLKDQENRNKELLESQFKSIKTLIYITIGVLIISLLISFRY